MDAPSIANSVASMRQNGLFLLFYFIFPIVYIGWLLVIGYALTKYVMLMAFILKLLKHI